MDYVFLVKTKKAGVQELYVLTNSVGEVCAIRTAQGEDGFCFVGDLRRAGHLDAVQDGGREPSYTVVRR